MATDDISLRVGRLEIESSKVNKIIKEDNPFVINSLQKKNSTAKLIPQNKCLCHVQKKKYAICKKKPSKILREPVLKLSQYCIKGKKSDCHKLFIQNNASECPLLHSSDNICLHSLVDTCNQLYISTQRKKNNIKTTDLNHSKWWQNDSSKEKQNRESVSERNSSSSCSQQALNPPCDVTIDELASYFETLVHIPKKMSSMAEMMYI